MEVTVVELILELQLMGLQTPEVVEEVKVRMDTLMQQMGGQV